MNKMKIKIFTLLSLLITFSLTLSSCDSLWDDLNTLPTYTITYNSNNGTGTMEPQIFEENVPQALSENKFTREGYTFAGWATKADATEAEYADKANFTATKDITLYAIWSVIPPAPVPSKYTITYVSTYGSKPANKEVDKGYKLTAEDLPDLKETGYRFINWDKVVGDEITSDTTITASWIKTWTISYASNKSELNDKLPTSKTVDEGYKLTTSDLNTLTADGYNFKGWDKSAGLEIKADVTITATWKKVVTISYSSTYGTKPDNKSVEEGYKLVVTDLPNIETDTQYGEWDKTVGTEINADTTITATWDDDNIIVYFDKSKITTYKSTAEKIIFTTDSYTGTGTGTTFDCASGSNSAYFTGVLDGTTLTIYGNGHRIYAPEDSKQLFNGFSKVTSIEFNNFYTSKVTNMQQMFYNCEGLTSLDLSSFDTSAVTNMMAMFNGCKALPSLNLSNFDTSNVTNMLGMFTGLSTITELNLSNFDTSEVTNMQNMFQGCSKLISIDLSNFDTSEVTNMQSMFQGCSELTSINLSSFDTTQVTTMSKMFYGCSKLEELDVSKFVTTNVTNMSSLFSGCSSLKTIDLSNWNTEKVTNMSSMFKGCKELTTLKISSLNTSKVSDMSYMFDTCEKLESLDLSHFNTSKVTKMNNMFNQCISLKSINVSSFDTSLVDDMSHMFNWCKKLTSIEVSNFNTSAVTTMNSMFQECISLISLDLSSFDKSSLVDIDTMFSECTELVTIYVSSGFDLSNISTLAVDLLFSGDSKLVGSEGSACNGSTGIDRSYARIDGGPTSETPGYFTLKQ